MFEPLGLNRSTIQTSFFFFLQSPVRGENTEVIADTDAVPLGYEDALFPPLKSEDSGIGLSASSPELSEHLRVPRVSPDKDDVWKKGGSMQKTFLCIQELIATFAYKNVFGVQLTASGEEAKSAEEPAGRRDESGKGSWEARPLGGVPQFKQMLSDLFTARGSPFKARSVELPSPPPRSPGRKKDEGWAVEQVVLDLGGSREGVREAFAAACHLLLECATFPVYLSEEEMEWLCEVLFQPPGEGRPRSLSGGVGKPRAPEGYRGVKISQRLRGRCLPTPIFLPCFIVTMYGLGLSLPDGNLRKLPLYLYNSFLFFFFLAAPHGMWDLPCR